jgi:hypothetical protein
MVGPNPCSLSKLHVQTIGMSEKCTWVAFTKATTQTDFVLDEGKGLSTKEQQCDPTSIINEVRLGDS